MAKPKLKRDLPDAIQRREILAGNPKLKVDLDQLGGRYLAEGWLSDAVDCFERTRNVKKLEEIRAKAIEGDVFLLQRLAKSEIVPVTPADWKKAAERALADGRDRLAAVAFEKAGDADRAAQAKEKVAALRAELLPPQKSRGGLSFAGKGSPE